MLNYLRSSSMHILSLHQSNVKAIATHIIKFLLCLANCCLNLFTAVIIFLQAIITFLFFAMCVTKSCCLRKCLVRFFKIDNNEGSSDNDFLQCLVNVRQTVCTRQLDDEVSKLGFHILPTSDILITTSNYTIVKLKTYSLINW